MKRDSLVTLRSAFLCLTLTGLLLAAPALAAPGDPSSLSPAPSLATGAPPAAVTGAPPAVVTGAPPAAIAAPPPAVVLPPVVAPERKRDETLFDTATWPVWAENGWVATSDVLHDHLRVGLRYRRVNPTDGKRTAENSFLGSITELETLDDYDPITWLTFEWLATPYTAIRFNMDQLRSRTRTTSDDNHSDGDMNLLGPELMLIGRLPNESRFTPSVGIGYAWFQSNFEHNPMWYNGFGGDNRKADYDAWVAAGSPPWPNRGYRREIILDDTTALILMAALELRITKHLDLNLFVQHMEVQEVGVTYNLSFGGNVFETTAAKFPMSNVGYGAGVRWTF